MGAILLFLGNSDILTADVQNLEWSVCDPWDVKYLRIPGTWPVVYKCILLHQLCNVGQQETSLKTKAALLALEKRPIMLQICNAGRIKDASKKRLREAHFSSIKKRRKMKEVGSHNQEMPRNGCLKACSWFSFFKKTRDCVTSGKTNAIGIETHLCNF